MTGDRERLVIKAFVSLVNNLVDSFDVVELLNELTTQCAELLDVASAGLLLADRHHVLHVVAASSERTRSLELFQLQREEGPCLDCYRSGRAVSVADLSAEAARWPQFVPAARSAGYASVHAIPMRLVEDVFGTLGLFGTTIGALNDEDLSLGQALAHVASVAIVAGNAAAERATVAKRMQDALNSRVFIEQAKGVLAQQGELDMEQAFALLRRYSRDHSQRLTDVAQAVVYGEIAIGELLQRRPSA